MFDPVSIIAALFGIFAGLTVQKTIAALLVMSLLSITLLSTLLVIVVLTIFTVVLILFTKWVFKSVLGVTFGVGKLLASPFRRTKTPDKTE